MDEALQAAVQKLGVPEGMTDPVQIITFLAGKASAGEVEMPQMPEVENMVGEDEKPEGETWGHRSGRLSLRHITHKIKQQLQRMLRIFVRHAHWRTDADHTVCQRSQQMDAIVV